MIKIKARKDCPHCLGSGWMDKFGGWNSAGISELCHCITSQIQVVPAVSEKEYKKRFIPDLTNYEGYTREDLRR